MTAIVLVPDAALLARAVRTCLNSDATTNYLDDPGTLAFVAVSP